MVVVQAPRPARGRGGRRRRNRNARRGSMGRRSGGAMQAFVFSKDSILGNGSGVIKFGPNLSESPAFSTGLLAAFHQYKIVMVKIEFISEASSTDRGSIAYEIDPTCKLASVESTLRKFGVTSSGVAVLRAGQINGQEWKSSKEEQFYIAYKGNGSAVTAGSFRITMNAMFQNPK